MGADHPRRDAALPAQPAVVGAVAAGNRELPGWQGLGRPWTWADIISSARLVGEAAGVTIEVRAAREAPWHPGRCAALVVKLDDDRQWVAGYAGELHPRVIAAYGLPARTVALELDLQVVYTAAAVEAALRAGAGPLLEDLRLFDVYIGAQAGADRKSLAYTLHFRAPDRTLTAAEASQARDAAVAEAARQVDAVLRT